jgi:hypothetical protein
MRVQIAVGAVVIAALAGCGSSGSSSAAGQGAAAAADSALAASPLGQCVGAVTRLLVQAEAAYDEGYSQGIDLNSVMEQYGVQSPVPHAFASLEGLELRDFAQYSEDERLGLLDSAQYGEDMSSGAASVTAQAPQACEQDGA